MKLPSLTLIFLLILTSLLVVGVQAVSWTETGGCWTAIDGTDTLVMWNTTGSDTWTPPSGVTNIQYLVVAGGGGGAGGASGGGGGAGGYLTNYLGIPLTIDSGTKIITVGVGGHFGTTNNAGDVGGNSKIENYIGTTDLVATGGGGGGGYYNHDGSGSSVYIGFPGGSGSGAGGKSTSGDAAGGAANGDPIGQGHDGGHISPSGAYVAGGGGGAAEEGFTNPSGSASGDGGDGYSNAISGTATDYASGGGGGGCSAPSASAGAGGLTDGGAGSVSGVGGAGTTNRGSGGGGGGTSGGAGGSGIVIIRYSGTPATPVSSFTSTNISIATNSTARGWEGLTPFKMQFENTSTSPPHTSWVWNYTEITTPNTPITFNQTAYYNPTYIFGSPGNYTIQLNVTGSHGTNISTQTTWINVTSSGIVPSFTAAPQIGVVPLTVQFNDTSSMLNTQSWNWSVSPGYFFNTTDPSLKNLSYTYNSAGTYDATLIIHNASTSGSLTHTSYVTVYNSTTAAHSSNKSAGYPTLPVQFTNNDANSTSWYWIFGDGTTSTDENPAHSYTSPGTYQINHSATNPAMTAWDNTSTITVYNPATIQFNPNSVYAGTLSKNATVFFTVQNLTDIQAIRINVSHEKLWIQSIKPVENTTYFTGAVLESSVVDNTNGFTVANISKTTLFNSPSLTDKPFGEIHYSYYNETNATSLSLSFNEAQYLYGGKWYNFPNTNTGEIIPHKEYNIELTIKNSQTLSLITSGVSIIWSGTISGIGSTTTGLYNLSSPNGTVMVYFTSPGYQAYSSTYTISGVDQTQTVYLTEEDGVSIVQSPPKSVRFHVQGLWGDPLDNVIVTAQAISTPLGDWEWLASLLGYPIGEIPLNNTIMGGTTDSQGDIAFLMMESTKYNVTSSKAGYTFDPLIVYPHDERYFIIAKQAGSQWYTSNYDYLKVINVSLAVEEISATEGFVNITYLDPLGGTTTGTIKVMQRSPVPGNAPTLLAEHPINSASAFCSTYILHTGPDMFDGYIVTNLTNSNVGGPVNITKTFWFKGQPMTLPGIDTKVTLWFALLIIIVTAMFAGASHAPQVSFIVCFECWIFYGIGFFSELFNYLEEWKMVTSLTFATFISLIWIWGERKKKEKY